MRTNGKKAWIISVQIVSIITLPFSAYSQEDEGDGESLGHSNMTTSR